LLAAVVYLSWKPSPSIMQVGWIPRLLGEWFDGNDGWKNFGGFGLLALTLLLAWRQPSSDSSEEPSARPARELRLFLGFCIFVEVMELGQLGLPLRTCDWRDVLSGWAGGLIAWSLLYAGRGCRAIFAEFRF
jgi:hypothetical protein